ncbi:uncharacterized protein [Prorops nasuta]|uniref:uncharacterized protein n=1 Tax=Prorops nasuta TaxID=863751 RepID=UPI0034CFF440
MKLTILVSLCLLIFVTELSAIPMIYRKKQDNIFEAVMIPVSSTVIPLPIYKVHYGLDFVTKNKKAQLLSKPEGNIKLITAKSSEQKN